MPHIHEKIDFTTTGYVVFENKVLLRFHEKHNIWLGAGGHIELHESPDVAVLREVKEETGLAAEIIGKPVEQFNDHSTDLPLPFALNRHPINESHDHIDFIYALKAVTNILNPATGEASNPEHFKWLSKEDLETANYVDDRVKSHALTALKLAENYA